MPDAPAHYNQLTTLLRDAALMTSVAHTLSWDQETMMPPRGAPFRAEQLKMLSSLAHQRKTDPRIGECLAACESDVSLTSNEAIAANLREIRRDYDMETKLPGELVAEMAECASLGMTAWKAARAKSNFPAFLPWLQKTIDLNRRKAECLGIPKGGSELYDALLDTFEPGMTAAETEKIFAPLRAFTVDLLKRVAEAPAKPSVEPARIELPIAAQRTFVDLIARQMGFDFDAGRIDDTTHPFCEGMGPGDTRMTNRYRADGWIDAVSTAMHEGGHAVYEQGLPKDTLFGQPLAEAISLGIHESQSRTWENLVGRSRAFWIWALPHAQRTFGAPLASLDPETIYNACNIVEPSFIRVESDEVTYNLHIMLRFDFERAMLRGDLPCKDLPGEWNKRIKNDFGIAVPEDRLGCLQDVHWSMGAVGYFPTYTFGNLYGAQFWETMAKDIPDRETRMAAGDFAPILQWTRDKIHAHGRRYKAGELCERITGRKLDSAPLMRHLEAKVAAVYGI